MKVSIEKNELVVRIPMNKVPVLSSSGKSKVIASTHGNQITEVKIDGEPVKIGLNAYISVRKNGGGNGGEGSGE